MMKNIQQGLLNAWWQNLNLDDRNLCRILFDKYRGGGRGLTI